MPDTSIQVFGFYSNPSTVLASQRGIANWRYVGGDVNGSEVQRGFDEV